MSKPHLPSVPTEVYPAFLLLALVAVWSSVYNRCAFSLERFGKRVGAGPMHRQRHLCRPLDTERDRQISEL